MVTPRKPISNYGKIEIIRLKCVDTWTLPRRHCRPCYHSNDHNKRLASLKLITKSYEPGPSGRVALGSAKFAQGLRACKNLQATISRGQWNSQSD